VRRVGGDVAVVYGKETAARADESGQEVARCLAWTDTWLRRDGRWQIVAVQDMLTPCK
jgi:hypothetical protein